MTFDVNRPEGGDALWVVGDRIRFLGGLPASGMASGMELIEVEVPAGSGTPPHSHESAELFYIVSGAMTLRQFAGKGEPPAVILAGPGEAVRIAPHMPHNYANESGEPAKTLVLLESAMIAFFRDVGTDERQDRPDFARLGAAMERYGIHLLAPAA